MTRPVNKNMQLLVDRLITLEMIVDRAESTGAFQMAVRAGKRTSQRRLAAGGIESRARLVEVLAAASLVTGAASLGTPTL